MRTTSDKGTGSARRRSARGDLGGAGARRANARLLPALDELPGPARRLSSAESAALVRSILEELQARR